MPSIYMYERSHDYLRDMWLEKRKANPRFSVRAWAKQFGYSSNAPLSLVLTGKRPVPRTQLPAYVKALKLAGKEARYFMLMVSFESAKTAEEKSYYAQEIESLVGKAKHGVNNVVDSFKLIADPLHMTLLEMVNLRSFQPEPKWIQRRLRKKYKLDEISTALVRLEKMGLLRRDGEVLAKTFKNVTTSNDVRDEGVRIFHRESAQMAATMLDSPMEEREFQGLALNIRKEQMAQAKEMIRRFRQEFNDQFDAPPGVGDETYQMNIQFFSLTKELNS